ncbi:MAG: sulfatase-like hydrolase/transferase [Burkholderiaceae bacterium]
MSQTLAPSNKKPNILIIMADEHDPLVSNPYGDSLVRTPNLQRLAQGGATFENAYCNSPLCVTSRTSFMTGQHLYRNGCWDNSLPLGSEVPTWAHRLNAAGYETCLAGKMHFIGPDQLHGFKRRIMPDIHGSGRISGSLPDWDTGIPASGVIMRKRLMEQPGPGNYLHLDYDEEVTSRVTRYLSEPERKEQPWVLCAAIFSPHFPFIVRPELYHYYLDKVDLPHIPDGHLESQHPQNKNLRKFFDCDNIPPEQARKAKAAYYGLVEYADEQIGVMLDSLQANGLADNTIIIYVSDHGEMLGRHGLWYKCSFYDPSVRIPLIVNWPEKIQPGSRFTQITSLLDVTSTLLDIAGADDAYTDGDSLLPLLTGQAKESEGTVLAEYEGHGVTTVGRMIRRGRYKLNYYYRERSELFDLVADPDEFHDLIDEPQHAALIEELTALITEDWDPKKIYDDVVRSQKVRLITAKGSYGPWSPPWRAGSFG